MRFGGWRPGGRSRYQGKVNGTPNLLPEPPMKGGLFDQGFEDTPGVRPPQTTEPRDRGSRRGARRCIVTDDLQILDHSTAKAASIKGKFFQSRKEAKVYTLLARRFQAGRIRLIPGLDRWSQVHFPLYALRADGLKAKVCDLVLDFAYEEPEPRGDHVVWVRRYDDVKPGGGLREDTYRLKKKWFEIQYGVAIREM